MMTDTKTGRQMIQDTDEKTGKSVWKVFNANNKVIIITQNEHTAKYYYERK
jgi:translation elongation factor P/translation initiation factor 5A|tara:strand:- start:583 stop:735 length:153 start_codon:yes stop_codon:yes gene_type:complete